MTGRWPRSFACCMAAPALAGRAPHSSRCLMWTRSPSSTADNDACSLDLRDDHSLKSWLCLITLEIRDSWQLRLLTWTSKHFTPALWHILIRGTSNRKVFSCYSACNGGKKLNWYRTASTASVFFSSSVTVLIQPSHNTTKYIETFNIKKQKRQGNP